VSQAGMEQTGTPLRSIFPGSSSPGSGREGARCALNSTKNVEDLIPYSPQELKYLWILWDEAQRHRQPSQRHRNIYAGAVAAILAGRRIYYGMGLSFSPPVGGRQALPGALTGG
jgi:hypothetical protein